MRNEVTVDLIEFDRLPENDAREALRPCLDVERWIDAVATARPYGSLDAVLETARTGASPLTPDEIDQAMTHHPRIGEKAAGESAEAAHSAREQASLGTLDATVDERLRTGNAAYEERFDRVFLIRAAGRTPAEILDELDRRMTNDDDAEIAEVGHQLIEIAVLRLHGLLT